MKIWYRLGLIGLAGVTHASPDQVTFFEKHIRPVLSEHCYECHNSLPKRRVDWLSTGKSRYWPEAIVGQSWCLGRRRGAVCCRSCDTPIRM